MTELVLAALLAFMVTAERQGPYLVVHSDTPGEYKQVEITTYPAATDLQKIGDTTWRVKTTATSGKFFGVICDDVSCEPVESVFQVSGASLAYTLAISLLVGFLMNFMPCVLPVLGLKLAAVAKGGGKLPYVLGVQLSFLALGLASLVLGAGFSQMSLPEYRVILTAVCFFMGTNLLGLWELPAIALGRLGNSASSFGIGIVTVALGSSCAVPFLAPVMIFCGAGHWYEALAVFQVIGLGFCLPFILPVYKFMPKPGPWLHKFEVACGAAMLCATLWLSMSLPTYYLILTYILVIGAGVAWAYSKQSLDWAAFISLAVIGAVLYGFAAKPAEDEFNPNIDQTKPGIIYVTADWCLNCEAAHVAIHDNTIKTILRQPGWQLTELDWTNRNEYVTQFLKEWGTASVPFALVVSETGVKTPVYGICTVEKLKQALYAKQ